MPDIQRALFNATGGGADLDSELGHDDRGPEGEGEGRGNLVGANVPRYGEKRLKFDFEILKYYIFSLLL